MDFEQVMSLFLFLKLDVLEVFTGCNLLKLPFHLLLFSAFPHALLQS